ncbi:MAG: hypothetical protein GVY15_06255 [Bacteroidetes bacterium]|nr:hypothetical protein [Bacteroidota bacterium]
MQLQLTNITDLSEQRQASERRHLIRVLAWGGSNVLGGAALWASGRDEAARGFGQQSALWGAVNVGIAAVGLLGGGSPPDAGFGTAVRAERRYHDILLANLGLNVGYMGVGTAMVVAAGEGVDRNAAWRGHGTALILQGMGLLALDAISWVASRSRLGKLLSMPGDTSAAATPGGLGITVRF